MASTCHCAHGRATVRPTSSGRCSGLPRPFRTPGGPVARPAKVLVRAKPQDGKQELDPIEKMVSFFFPKALSDPAPMGLKRLNFDELPDQYCEMDVLAPLLPGDEKNPDVTAFRPLLARTQLERRSLKLAYDADLDGWSPAAFHGKVDGLGAAVVLAKTAGGAVVGGYNPEGWIGLGEDRASNGAFLFTWPDGNTKQRAFKIAKVGGPNLAVIDNPSSGPQFGADGLTIPLKPRGQERLAKCKLGTYYARLPDGSRTVFSVGDDAKKAELVSLKVYVADAKGVEWRLEGITWKSVVVEN